MSSAPLAQYFQRRTNMSRRNCTYLVEQFRLDAKTGLLETVSVYEDGVAYLSAAAPFSVPAEAVPSTAAVYAAARYKALRAMARRRMQQRAEKDLRKKVDEMRKGLAAVSQPAPAAQPRKLPVIIAKQVEKPVEASLPQVVERSEASASPAMVVAEATPAASSVLDDFTIIDLEFQVNDMLELAAIRYQNWEPVGEVVSFVRFTGTLYRNITELTGITALHLHDAPDERWVLERFKLLAGDSLIVCHSVGADKRVLEAARTRQGAKKELPNPWLCTLALAKRRVKAGLLPHAQKCGLGELCQHFKIKVRGAHRAKADVLMTFQMLRALHQQQPVTKGDLHGAPQPGKRKPSTAATPGLLFEAA